jgi:DNA-binding TFAR19-related protein (PDSD5 family)
MRLSERLRKVFFEGEYSNIVSGPKTEVQQGAHDPSPQAKIPGTGGTNPEDLLERAKGYKDDTDVTDVHDYGGTANEKLGTKDEVEMAGREKPKFEIGDHVEIVNEHGNAGAGKITYMRYDEADQMWKYKVNPDGGGSILTFNESSLKKTSMSAQPDEAALSKYLSPEAIARLAVPRRSPEDQAKWKADHDEKQQMYEAGEQVVQVGRKYKHTGYSYGPNGKFGVKDSESKFPSKVVAAGMDEAKAKALAVSANKVGRLPLQPMNDQEIEDYQKKMSQYVSAEVQSELKLKGVELSDVVKMAAGEMSYYIDRIERGLGKLKDKGDLETQYNAAFDDKDDASMLRKLRVLNEKINKALDAQAEMSAEQDKANLSQYLTPEARARLADYGLHVTKFPSGKYGYVGSVPKDLAITHADGSPLSDQEWAEYKQASTPAMIKKSRGYKEPTFASEQEAIDFAKQHGHSAKGKE